MLCKFAQLGLSCNSRGPVGIGLSLVFNWTVSWWKRHDKVLSMQPSFQSAFSGDLSTTEYYRLNSKWAACNNIASCFFFPLTICISVSHFSIASCFSHRHFAFQYCISTLQVLHFRLSTAPMRVAGLSDSLTGKELEGIPSSNAKKFPLTRM